MLEMTFGMIFLMLIVLILFEMAMLFLSYIALLNASREGAVFASTHAGMTTGSPDYAEYENICRAEALAAGLNTDTAFFQILAPSPGVDDQGRPSVLVMLRYQLINPTHGIVLPFLDRLGLFSSAWMTAYTEMPVR